ncbi:MAG: response regulator [Candidatus Methylacidiphilales bacterium]
MKSETVRILIVDDHSMVREGLKTLLSKTTDLKVCGTEDSGEAALENLDKTAPDVVLLDIRLPGMNGIDCCRRIKEKCHSTRVIMLTSYLEGEMILEAMNAGASGYLLKEIESEQLFNSVRQVMSGQTAMPGNITQCLLDSIGKNKNNSLSDIAGLSTQELKISSLVSKGLLNKEIGDQLGLTEKTVKNHLTHIFSKLHVNRRSQLAVLYAEYARMNPED